jgi:hypothetical protein
MAIYLKIQLSDKLIENSNWYCLVGWDFINMIQKQSGAHVKFCRRSVGLPPNHKLDVLTILLLTDNFFLGGRHGSVA